MHVGYCYLNCVIRVPLLQQPWVKKTVLIKGVTAHRISSHYKIASHLIELRKPCDDDMTSVADGRVASSRLHISATLTVFIEVPKEVEPNRCNQVSQQI